MKVVLIAVASITGGLALDASGLPGARLMVVVWSWVAISWVFMISDAELRRQLCLCVVIGALGELFLINVWGLYTYRLGGLPAFVPAGHALAYAAAVHLARHTPSWWPTSILCAITPWVLYAGWKGIDTQGLLWFPLLLVYFSSRDRNLYATLFVLALLCEGYGTTVGGWHYHPREPLFSLTTTNPPVTVGVIYCTLAMLVRTLSRFSARLTTA